MMDYRHVISRVVRARASNLPGNVIFALMVAEGWEREMVKKAMGFKHVD